MLAEFAPVHGKFVTGCIKLSRASSSLVSDRDRSEGQGRTEMNDQRAITAETHAPDPGALQRAWLQSTTTAREPFARCVLIVDGLRSDVQLLETMLRMAGASTVHVLTDAETAVGQCREIGPELVVVDLDMPRIDRDAVLAALREIFPGDGFLPVMVLTSDTTAYARERALGAGANEFLTKPYDQVEFVGRVSNLLTMQALYQLVQRQNLELQAHE
jgi:PleD family two-component response regulator